MYEFKGYDWEELADCWDIDVSEDEFAIVNIFMNGEKISITTYDYEEVIAYKIKKHIWNNLDMSSGNFKDKSIRDDLHRFLKALIKESKKLDHNFPVYKGMLKVKGDYTLARWVCDNLEKLWT